MKKPAISILSALVGAVFGAGAVGKMSMDKTKKIQSMSDKHLELFKMMDQWVKVKQEGKSRCIWENFYVLRMEFEMLTERMVTT